MGVKENEQGLLVKKAREFEMGCNDDIAFFNASIISTESYTFVGSSPFIPDFIFFSDVYTILEQCTIV